MKKGRYNAVLLLGPTGSGKTPLGEYLEKNGLKGKKCFHFDFGENLRLAADKPKSFESLSKEDVDIIRNSLENGTLLEDSQFYLAERIFETFVAKNNVAQTGLVILNGFPRHIDQAKKTAELVDVKLVIFLDCDDQVVSERINENSGGDRTFRTDDNAESVAAKCILFRNRTMPLIEHYRKNPETKIVSVKISASSTPKDIALRLKENLL